MKSLFRALAVSSLSLFSCSLATAQQDSVLVTYDEEPAESSNFSLKEKYKYFTRATVEEKFYAEGRTVRPWVRTVSVVCF